VGFHPPCMLQTCTLQIRWLMFTGQRAGVIIAGNDLHEVACHALQQLARCTFLDSCWLAVVHKLSTAAPSGSWFPPYWPLNVLGQCWLKQAFRWAWCPSATCRCMLNTCTCICMHNGVCTHRASCPSATCRCMLNTCICMHNGVCTHQTDILTPEQ
jgi:hypothetical protein